MDITSLNSLNSLGAIQKRLFADSESTGAVNRNETFENMFQSALSMINETNEYSHQAEEAEMSYAMGIMTSTHDLQIAQQKANISLQYTVAVRNAVLDAYKEIMQLQF